MTDVFITVRKDRRPDRVEISPEQLSAGSHHVRAGCWAIMGEASRADLPAPLSHVVTCPVTGYFCLSSCISMHHRLSPCVQAESRAAQTGLPIRVLGWYHSHPNLTVWPSHVGKPCLLPLASKYCVLLASRRALERA